jgi:hypothetical protein
VVGTTGGGELITSSLVPHNRKELAPGDAADSTPIAPLVGDVVVAILAVPTFIISKILAATFGPPTLTVGSVIVSLPDVVIGAVRIQV